MKSMPYLLRYVHGSSSRCPLSYAVANFGKKTESSKTLDLEVFKFRRILIKSEVRTKGGGGAQAPPKNFRFSPYILPEGKKVER